MIDGVVDTDDYYASRWSNNLLDADKTMCSFYQSCDDAGEDGCEFWAPTADGIHTNLTRLYETLKKKPLPVNLSDGRFGLADHELLRSTVFKALYSPFALFPPLARALSNLANGDGRALFSLKSKARFQCNSCGKHSHAFDNVDDGQLAVLCNDGAEFKGGLEGALRHYHDLSKKSEWGPSWSRYGISCVWVALSFSHDRLMLNKIPQRLA